MIRKLNQITILIIASVVKMKCKAILSFTCFSYAFNTTIF